MLFTGSKLHTSGNVNGDNAADAESKCEKNYLYNESRFADSFNCDLREELIAHGRTTDDRTKTDSQIRDDMASDAIRFMFAKQPPRPAPSKWTKLCPAVDFVLRAWHPHNLLHAAHELAFEKMPFQDWTADDGYKVVEELEWEKVAGSRCKQNRQFLSSADARVRAALLDLVVTSKC